MPEKLSSSLQQKIEERLRYYEDLGIRLFYKERTIGESVLMSPEPKLPAFPSAESTRKAAAAVASAAPAPVSRVSETIAPKPSPSPASKLVNPASLIVSPPSASLFEATDKIQDDSPLKIREDIGDCKRCKLHSTRHTIVFADGNPKADLVFVGEGPGADEDAQGIPFVGRAGKLLTQMIEAMGLQRRDVYICNVVKCRPPENRTPEPDEIATCSPYLFRQIDVVDPKVIVALGAVAAKTLLNTNRGISHYRGEWQEFRGRKLMATYHPAYLLRNPPAKADVWKDLQKVMAELGLTLPKKPKA
jgi:uracil-DNA glycosylase